MAYRKKKKIEDFTSQFEKDLIIAVGGKGFVTSIGSMMYDVEYRGQFFSIVDNVNEGMQIVKTFCSKKNCKKEFGMDYKDVLALAEQLDFNEEKTHDLGKCIIMDISIALDDISPKRIRNVFEQIMAANEALRERIRETESGE